MKKLFLLSVLISFVQSESVAQSIAYHNYLNYNSEWRWAGDGWNGVEMIRERRTIYFDGDTVINGLAYYKRHWVAFYISNFQTNSPDTIVNTSTVPLLMREDPDGNFYTYNSSQVDVLYFDNQQILNASSTGISPMILACPLNGMDTVYLGTRALLWPRNHLLQVDGAIEGVGEAGPTCDLPIEGGTTLEWYTVNIDSLHLSSLPFDAFPTPVRTNELGTNELKKNSLISLYPNPATDQITINNPRNIQAQLTLFDVSGRMIKSEKLSTFKLTMDVADLPAGAYCLVIGNNGLIETQKLIKY